jgi:hypothetical protein
LRFRPYRMQQPKWLVGFNLLFTKEVQHE